VIQSKPFYESVTLWVNVLSVLAVAAAVSLQLSGQLDLTAQEVAIGTVVLAVVNGAIRVLRTNQPITNTPAEAALIHAAVKRRLTED
jgi:hypothetical protein